MHIRDRVRRNGLKGVGLGGLGWKEAREWEGGGNAMNAISKL